MSFKMLTGPYLNHLTRTASVATMSPSAETLYPSTNLYDNRSGKPSIYTSDSSDSTVTVDLNLLLGEFESTGQTDTWSILGVGTINMSTSDAYSGSGSAYLTKDAGAATVIAYEDVTARPDEELTLFAAAHRHTATNTSLLMRNRQTGDWLTSTGGWTASSSAGVALTTTSTSWVEVNITFSMQGLEECLADTVTLRTYLVSAGGNSYFDQIEVYPSVNWCSVHGHNIPPFITPTLQYSNDATTWVTQSAMTLQRDSFYVATSSGTQAHRYWRLLLSGKPDTGSQMFLGELVLGQYFDIIHNPLYGGTLRWVDRQTRLESDQGEAFVSLHNQAPQRTLLLNFIFPSSTEYEQFHRQVFRGSRGGGNVLVIAPEEMDSSVVVLGRVRDQVDVVKNTSLERTSSLEIVEMPLPNATDVAHAYDTPVVSTG